MVDVNPEIWENKTLGEAAHNERLDRLEKQQHEDRSARLENREAREVVVENTYPGWTPPVQDRTGTVPSNYTPVHFADENPNDIVQTGENVKPEGMSDGEWQAQENTEPEIPGAFESEPDGTEHRTLEEQAEIEARQSETTGLDSTEESDSTQWT